MTRLLLNIAFVWLLGAGVCSCTSTKNLQYLQGNLDSAKFASYTIPEPIIQKGDILAIVVYSNSKVAADQYNQAMAGGAGGAAPSTAGYLVDTHGDIQFQGLGVLHVEGLNKAQVADTVTQKLKDYLTNPYVNIRFVNFKVTVIGDVARPGVYTIPSERVNLLEVLGLAGDLNVTARRDNVRIIREQNGKREFGLIDLRQPGIFTSPFYQLKQNDMVYVDLGKNKAAASDQTTVRNISVAATIVSTIALLYTIFRNN